ncbi:BnaCnng35510D [Brassica napus]|uniref:BnaCnng35510D protein n=1 Tax=Brassica napus TaxID=3708 RepID=A0A078J5Y6_BRANA|nr:BnaCnng35510D [Brassica napus]
MLTFQFIQPPSHLSSLLIKVNIFAKDDDLQNQAQPLEDFARRLKPKEKSVVTVVRKTFDQLVSNCPDNVHLEVSKTKRPLC